MEYTIRSYSPSLLPSLVKLLHHSFVIANRDKRALVSWKYFHPFFAARTISWVAIDPTSNAVVGHYTNIPIPIAAGSRSLRSMLCTDMATHQDHRGNGIITTLAKQVYAKVRESGAVCSFGFSNSQGIKVDRNARGYGYEVVGTFIRYVRLVGIPRASDFSLVRIAHFTHPEFEPRLSQFHVKKDAAYRTWRYEDKPHNDYKLFELRLNETFCGFVVLRILNTTCHVYDLIIDEELFARLPGLLMAIRSVAAAQGCRWVVCSTLAKSRMGSAFLRARFVPTSLRSQSYYLTVKCHQTALRSSGILDARNWILFGGDIL